MKFSGETKKMLAKIKIERICENCENREECQTKVRCPFYSLDVDKVIKIICEEYGIDEVKIENTID